MLEIYLQVSQGRSAKARAKDIFDSLDKDGDGELTMNEFVDGYLVMMVDSWKVPGIEKRGTPELQLTRWTRLLIRVQPTVNFVPDRTTFVSVTRVTNLDKNCIRNWRLCIYETTEQELRGFFCHKVHYIVSPSPWWSHQTLQDWYILKSYLQIINKRMDSKWTLLCLIVF